LLELINQFEIPDAAPNLQEPETDAIDANSQIVSSSLPEGDPAPSSSVESQPPFMSEAPHHYVSTVKSEKILKEILNKGSARQDTTLSSFLDGLVGEINEK
jgi:hypothetical protein